MSFIKINVIYLAALPLIYKVDFFVYLQISLTTDQINIPHPGKLFIGPRFFLAPKIYLEDSGAAGINKYGKIAYLQWI